MISAGHKSTGKNEDPQLTVRTEKNNDVSKIFILSLRLIGRSRIIIIIIIMTLFKCQMYLARTALIGDTFQIELEFRNVGF